MRSMKAAAPAGNNQKEDGPKNADNLSMDVPGQENNLTVVGLERADNLSMDVPEQEENLAVDVLDRADNFSMDVPEQEENLAVDVLERSDNLTMDVPEQEKNLAVDVLERSDNLTMDVPEQEDYLTVDVLECADNLEKGTVENADHCENDTTENANNNQKADSPQSPENKLKTDDGQNEDPIEKGLHKDVRAYKGPCASSDPPQNSAVGGGKKSRKPPRYAIFQQTMSAWEPILSAWNVIPFIFFVGILCIPIGIGLLSFSNKVTEVIIPYTDCISTIHTGNQKCADILAKNKNAYCKCAVPFTLDEQLRHNVYMYYALTNFYQNHRRYIKSRDENQLSGNTDEEPDDNCEPYAYKDGKKIYPCGAVADSLFNDEITLHYYSSDGVLKPVGLIRTGIAWNLDKKLKFKNPKDFSATSPMWKTCTKPKSWKKELWELDPENPENNGIQNEDFIVWMRIAHLPYFRKLYRIVNISAEGFIGGLPKGKYSLEINYSYAVDNFGGTKSIVLSNTSLFGGKNDFLGVTYIFTGGFSLTLGLGLLILHIKHGKSTWEKIEINPKTKWDVAKED